MKITPHRLLAASLGALSLLASGSAMAQSYPTRPIKVVVPLGPGSTGDIVARAVSAEMSKTLGQSLVIENKPGAGGSIAMNELTKVTPDGYTISFASQGNLVFNLSIYAKPGYDSAKDFAPISLVGGVSNVMVVHPQSKIDTVQQFVQEVRANPGKVSYSSGGNGTSHHLSGVLFSQMTNTQLLHVPYKGAAQGVMSVMSGETQVGFYNTPSVISQIKGGKLKALAVTSTNPSPLLVQTPTVASTLKGFEVNTWFGFIAPAATPAPVISKLQEAVKTALSSPALKANLMEQGVDLAQDQSAASFSKLIQDDLDKWPAIIKASGASVD